VNFKSGIPLNCELLDDLLMDFLPGFQVNYSLGEPPSRWSKNVFSLDERISSLGEWISFSTDIS